MLTIWIWFCAYLNAAGWVLSALHQLNAAGYMVVLALWFGGLAVWCRQIARPIWPSFRRTRFRRHCRKPFPLAFLILAALAFIGGALYPPSNYDALAYRVPRVLHWLAADQWHWIHTIFPRINTRSCGIEWVSAPVIALLKTDRPLFLINFISFLLLPGLVFSVLTRLGVRRRVAWHWMWLAPTGYGFLLQAGSIGNDLFGATFALAALDLALRTKTSRAPLDLLTSILAAALLTSAKTSNLPLLLPWSLALLPSWHLAFRWPLRTAGVCVLALLASALPTMMLNKKNCGDWSGLVYETGYFKNAPLTQAVVGAGLLTLENFAPPVFPLADKWNQNIGRFIPTKWQTILDETVMPPDSKLQVVQMQIEEQAGLGFGVCLLLLLSLLAAIYWRWHQRGKISSVAPYLPWQQLVRFAPVVSLLALFSQSHMCTISRLVISYYALLLPVVLAGPAQSWVIRQRWWRVGAAVVFLIAAGLVILSPARPLFPVRTILDGLEKHLPNSPALARAREVYTVYRDRNDAFAPIRNVLPPDAAVLGITIFDTPETSLWRPFGSRRMEHVCPEDSAADLKARGVEYILIRPDMFGKGFGGSLEDWLRQMNARVVQKIPLNLRAATGTLDWYLVRLD